MIQPAQLADRLDALAGSTFAAVLFDMDGTLIDSTPAVERSWITWATEQGIDPYRLLGFHGVPAASIVAALVDDPAAAPAALARITEIETADVDGVVPLPGAVAALTELADRAAIATSSTAGLAAVRLAASQLPAPAVVVTADDVTHGKPAPEPYQLAAQRLGVDPGDCLVVEDAPAGITAGRAAGCRTLGVTTTTPADKLPADAVIDDLSQVRFSVVDGRVVVQPA